MRVRFVDAGMTIGSFVLVVGLLNCPARIPLESFPVFSGRSFPPVRGLVTWGSGEDNILLKPRSTVNKYIVVLDTQ